MAQNWHGYDIRSGMDMVYLTPGVDQVIGIMDTQNQLIKIYNNKTQINKHINI